jgi:hypothetical protein
VSLTWAQVGVEARARRQRGVRIARREDWAVVIELQSSRGANDTWLSVLSGGTEAVNVLASATGMEPVSYMVDGQLVTRFEPSIPAFRSGSRPDGFLDMMREVGLDPDLAELQVDTRVAALALLKRVFGVTVSGGVVMEAAIFSYIEIFYNRQRRHSQLDYVSPIEYELCFENPPIPPLDLHTARGNEAWGRSR